MNSNSTWGNLVILFGVIMVGFAIPHLIDDFLFDVPEDFGLSNIQAQFLAGVFSAILIVVFSLAARGKKLGFFGAGFLGGFLSLAGILKHMPRMLKPGPYWSGLFSEILILGLIISGILLLIVSILALRNDGQKSLSE